MVQVQLWMQHIVADLWPADKGRAPLGSATVLFCGGTAAAGTASLPNVHLIAVPASAEHVKRFRT